MEEELIMQIKDKNFAILDVEFIQTSKIHKCIRKLYILAKDGYTDMELDFKPCKPLYELSKFYQRSFQSCEIIFTNSLTIHQTDMPRVAVRFSKRLMHLLYTIVSTLSCTKEELLRKNCVKNSVFHVIIWNVYRVLEKWRVMTHKLKLMDITDKL